MSLQKAIERAFEKKRNGGWKTWPLCWWQIDLHDCIIPGTYSRNNLNRELYPLAEEVLQWLSKRKDMGLILWTSSHKDAIDDILRWLAKKNIVFNHVNANPECPNTELCNFSNKFFTDIILDDKAGFDGKNDWYIIKMTLLGLEEWDKESHEETKDMEHNQHS